MKSTLSVITIFDVSKCRLFDVSKFRRFDVSIFSKMISNVKGFSTYLCTPQNYKPIHHLLVMLDEKIQSEGFLPSLFSNDFKTIGDSVKVCSCEVECFYVDRLFRLSLIRGHIISSLLSSFIL